MIMDDWVQRSSRGPWVLEVVIGCERSRRERDELPIIRRSIEGPLIYYEIIIDLWPRASCVVVQERKFCAGKLLII